jgi:hypothetical protein
MLLDIESGRLVGLVLVVVPMIVFGAVSLVRLLTGAESAELASFTEGPFAAASRWRQPARTGLSRR